VVEEEEEKEEEEEEEERDGISLYPAQRETEKEVGRAVFVSWPQLAAPQAA
jgi:hypothetical protein